MKRGKILFVAGIFHPPLPPPRGGRQYLGEGLPQVRGLRRRPDWVRLHQQDAVLRGRPQGGLGVSRGRLQGLREVAQGPPGQAVIFRRSHALSKGDRGPGGDQAADGGDRQCHTRLADRMSANFGKNQPLSGFEECKLSREVHPG